MIPTQTLARFIHSREKNIAGVSGELSELLNSIGLGVKLISRLVATAGFKGLYGYTGKTNVQGEKTHKLDEEADSVLVDVLGASGHFGSLVSEERDSALETSFARQDAKYVVAFDPLDGSSNIGTNIPVGTIFCIFRKRDLTQPSTVEDFLQGGRKVVAAGYSVYGSMTSFVYSAGEGVHGFTLDPSIGEFVLTEEDLRIPAQGTTYSVNEGYWDLFDPWVRSFISEIRSPTENTLGPAYSARYVGSLVADFDRTLRRGGVFLHPATSARRTGKLRLLYECTPLAFIMEQAGGIALDGERPVLDLESQKIHQRCPFMVGGTAEMNLLRSHVAGKIHRAT